MNSLFGVELPTPVNFIVAFVVVLALIGAATWLIRRLGATRLDAAARSRQPRLAVVDSAAVDGRRRLVIVRRDNVEHLLMIGGPNDLVVESSFLRGAAPGARPAPDAATWAAPEPAAPPPVVAAPMVRVERERPRVVAEEPAQWPPLQHEPVETSAPPIMPPVRAQRSPEPPRAAAPPASSARTADALAGLAAELAKPAPEPPRPIAAPEPPRPAPAARPAPAPTVEQSAATAAAAAAADKNLADMAQRLELALRQPAPATASPAAEAPRAAAPAAEVKPAPRPAPPPVPAATTATAPAKSEFEDFEQEMANLLGRSGKT